MSDDQPRRDLISTLAMVGTTIFIPAFLIAIGWRKAVGVIGVFVAVSVTTVVLLWIFRPADDDEDALSEDSKPT